MTRDEQEWELAGLTNENGELERPFSTAPLLITSQIRLDEAEEGIIYGAHNHYGGYRAQRVPVGGNLLKRFVRLDGQPPAEFLNYAASWGVLGLCEHGIPGSHSQLNFRIKGQPAPNAQRCRVRRRGDGFY